MCTWSRTLALVLLLTAAQSPACCQEQVPGTLLKGAQQQQRQQQQRHAGGGRSLLAPQNPDALQHAKAGIHDITVEEAILQTYHPDAVKDERLGAQQAGGEGDGGAAPGTVQRRALDEQRLLKSQQGQQGREEQLNAEQKARLAKAHAEAHARILQRQQKEAAAAGERLAASREEQKQQDSLGRGSLRTRKQPAKQPAVSGSRKDDEFAQQMERKLTDVRARLAAQRDAQAEQRPPVAPPKAQQQQERRQQGQAHGRRHQSIPLPVIVVMTLVMAAAAGLGALPFFFVRSMSATATGVATAIACGVMLAASFDLVHDGQPYGASLTVLGVLLGGWFIKWVQERLETFEDISFGSLQGSSARKTVLMVGIMAAHALGEGCAVGVSFCGERGWTQGVLTTLAIGVHNIPEGLAKATVLVGQGVTARRALAWSVVTCLPQPLVAVPSFMFVDTFTMILPVALGFAAGCMIWMVFAELLPDALERAQGSQVATAATVSAACLEGFRMFFSSMEQADGSFGGGAAAAHAIGVLARMGPPLLVLLPAVAAAAAGGGGLGGSAIPPPVAWGVAAAVALSSGGGSLIDQLVWRSQVPWVHTLAAGAVGAALAVLLHRQLLSWADSSAASLAARRLRVMQKEHGSAGDLAGAAAAAANGIVVGGRSAPDVEALEYSSLFQQHNLHHPPAKAHHHHSHPLPVGHSAAAGAAGTAMADGTVYMGTPGAGINGFGGSSSSLHYAAPYHRGGAAGNGSMAALPDGQSQLPSGATTPSGFGLALGGATTPVQHWRATRVLPAQQLAAAAAAALTLAAGAVTTGWHLACTLLLLDTDRSNVLLPAAALLLAGPGLGAGALARIIPSRSGGAAAGAWLGGLLAAVAALAAAVTAARAHESAHTAALVRRFLYPNGITDTAEALVGGALCAAAWFLLAAGTTIKAGSARGGLVLGLAVTGLLAGLRFALCSTTPYCLSVHTLLQQAR